MDPIDNDNETAVEIIRHRVRKLTEDDRKRNRNREFNKLRRTALGVQVDGLEFRAKDGQDQWKGKIVLQKVKELKKKTLSIKDYRQLEIALLQSQDNINDFMSVDQILCAVVRDLSSLNPEIQLLALHCCCNVALGGEKHCGALCKSIGPYLMTQLESRCNPLLEASAWTIGNLCSSGSKMVHDTLRDLGCFKRLASLLQSCQEAIIPSIAYALKFYLFGNCCPEDTRDSDHTQVTQLLSRRLSPKSQAQDASSESLWLLALLSSTPACRSHLSNPQFTATTFSHLTSLIETSEKPVESNASEIIPLLRLLGNLSSDESAHVADLILTNNENGRNLQILNKLLNHSHSSVRRESLWLIGNLYNHPSLQVQEAMRNHMEFFDFSSAVECGLTL